MSRIPLTECQNRGLYRVSSRNLDLAVFDGQSGFIGIRTKFGNRYLFTEYHHDDGAPYGTVHPKELLGTLPDGIEASESDEKLLSWLDEQEAQWNNS